MRMAITANAACLLVFDTGRGGVFASLDGTVELLDPKERAPSPWLHGQQVPR